MTLAIFGGKPEINGSLRRYNSIGEEEWTAVHKVMNHYRDGTMQLSGYLGGNLHGGPAVQRLEEQWATKFKVRHAIACNSATSGLLAACVAVRIDQVLVPALTMSATAAAPTFLGAYPEFQDIDAWFTLQLTTPLEEYGAVIATNLFGHPAHLHDLRTTCDESEAWLIEDNAQALLATENGQYTGTIGHIGVFSLNVHKQIQCGEGGIICTNNDELAHGMRKFINHGELAGSTQVGLNLRMTELEATIALCQLAKADELVAGRRILASLLNHMMLGDVLQPMVPRRGCVPSWYAYPIMVNPEYDRDWIAKALQAEGVPVRAGYVTPLHKLPAFKQYVDLPRTMLALDRLVLLEMCAIDPTDEQVIEMRRAFEKVIDGAEKHGKKSS